MKKQFFWLALGVSTLCACTETDVIEESSVQSNAIGFENVIRKTTRAEVTGDLDQDGFDLF
ncbi:MAG: hypothetical protein K2K86_05905, partial [Muribaculaceae bacterium]|nr:hypothetical protein [Muribaculaceae bacterium]